MDTFWIPVPTAWISPQVVKRVGNAIWLLMMLLSRTTCSRKGLGLVYGGRELRDIQLFSDLGISQSTMTRYRATLEECGFVHTKTEWFGLKRWFLIGCYKYQDRPVTERQSRLISIAWREIVADLPEEDSRIINPFYVELVSENAEEALEWIKDEDRPSNIEDNDSNSGDSTPKNDVRITDKLKDKIKDKNSEEKRGAFGRNQKTVEKVDADILYIYNHYDQVLEINSNKPSERAIKNNGTALERVSSGNLNSSIHEYSYQRSQEGISDRPMSHEAFFEKRYLNYLQLPEDFSEPEDGPIF